MDGGRCSPEALKLSQTFSRRFHHFTFDLFFLKPDTYCRALMVPYGIQGLGALDKSTGMSGSNRTSRPSFFEPLSCTR